MFKKYCFSWKSREGNPVTVDFFVHSKSKRNGFMHQAGVIGPLPRLDSSSEDYVQYVANDEKAMKARYAKISYCNRTWESYAGQDCLKKLWNQLAALKFLDMSAVNPTNPFEGMNEPPHENLWEPEELFNQLSGR